MKGKTSFTNYRSAAPEFASKEERQWYIYCEFVERLRHSHFDALTITGQLQAGGLKVYQPELHIPSFEEFQEAGRDGSRGVRSQYQDKFDLAIHAGGDWLIAEAKGCPRFSFRVPSDIPFSTIFTMRRSKGVHYPDMDVLLLSPDTGVTLVAHRSTIPQWILEEASDRARNAAFDCWACPRELLWPMGEYIDWVKRYGRKLIV